MMLQYNLNQMFLNTVLPQYDHLKYQLGDANGKLLENEMNRLMHSVSIEMVSILQKHLPYIMEGVMTELKLELDKTHKCLLLKDSKIKDKDCQ